MERRVRGSVINAYLGFVEKKWGKMGLENCTTSLGIDKNLNDGHYYHDQVRENILRWISREKGEQYLEEAGSYVVQNLGILKWLVRFASPETIAKKFPKNYSEVYTFGRLEIDTSQENKIVVRLHDVSHIEETCMAWKGVCQGTLEATKTKGSVNKSKCQLKGNDHCEYVIYIEE